MWHTSRLQISMLRFGSWVILLTPSWHKQCLWSHSGYLSVQLVTPLSGRGAWQQWKYEVEVQEVGTQQNIQNSHNRTSFLDTVNLTVENLRPDTLYRFRVRAYTEPGGLGPWCPFVKSMTLRAGEKIITGNARLSMGHIGVYVSVTIMYYYYYGFSKRQFHGMHAQMYFTRRISNILN